MNKLIISKISKSFKSAQHEIKVLDNVCMTLNQGTAVGVIGASGSGKTTFLQILAGLEMPDKGDIFYNDHNLSVNNGKKFNSMRNNLFGYAYQFHYLLDDLTVYENCDIVFKIAGNRDSKKNSSKIMQILEELGIHDRKDSYPYMLSGGEKQRVAIARAIVHKPEFIIMDEPTGNLDQDNAEIIQDLSLKLAKNYNVGIVIATHDLKYAAKLDNVYRIENGELKSTYNE